MSHGQHNHNYGKIVRAEIFTYDNGTETIDIYKQCDCGRVWKDHQLVNDKMYDRPTKQH